MVVHVVVVVVVQAEGPGSPGDQEHVLHGHPETPDLQREGGRLPADPHRRHVQVKATLATQSYTLIVHKV